jgi:hypothetical protein
MPLAEERLKRRAVGRENAFHLRLLRIREADSFDDQREQ